MSICCWEKWLKVSWGLTKYVAAFQITYFSFLLLVCTAAVPTYIPFHALCIQIGHTLCFELWPFCSYICCCPCIVSLSLRLLQPSRQNKCWQCTFLQTLRLFTLHWHFLMFNFFILYCDNIVLEVCLGLSTKPTWLKVMFWLNIPWFWRPKHGWKMYWRLIQNITFFRLESALEQRAFTLQLSRLGLF